MTADLVLGRDRRVLARCGPQVRGSKAAVLAIAAAAQRIAVRLRSGHSAKL